MPRKAHDQDKKRWKILYPRFTNMFAVQLRTDPQVLHNTTLPPPPPYEIQKTQPDRMVMLYKGGGGPGGLATSLDEVCPLTPMGGSCEPKAPWSHVSREGGGRCITEQSQLTLITYLHWLLSFEKIMRRWKKKLAIQVNFSKLIANTQSSQGPLLA